MAGQQWREVQPINVHTTVKEVELIQFLRQRLANEKRNAANDCPQNCKGRENIYGHNMMFSVTNWSKYFIHEKYTSAICPNAKIDVNKRNENTIFVFIGDWQFYYRNWFDSYISLSLT